MNGDFTLEFPPEITGPCVDHEFMQGMVDRMAVSYYKYGPITEEAIKKRDMIATIKLRLEKYIETHNTEWLMDVANYCMIEYMVPTYTDAFFRSTDGDESPGYLLKDGQRSWSHERDLT